LEHAQEAATSQLTLTGGFTGGSHMCVCIYLTLAFFCNCTSVNFSALTIGTLAAAMNQTQTASRTAELAAETKGKLEYEDRARTANKC